MASCPSCAGPIADAQRFCPGCGTALDVSDSPTGTAPRHRTPASASPAGGSRRTPTPGGAARRPPAERVAPGTVVAERYRILGLLGRGGMVEVYRADDLKLEHPVALKFLPQELEKSGERLERFFGEVRIARQGADPGLRPRPPRRDAGGRGRALRDAVLHVPRTAPRARGDRPQRHLFTRPPPLRAVHGAPCLPGQDGRGADAEAPRREPGGSRRARP